MYCGACARDLALIRGLRARHHDVQVIPLYTPVKAESRESSPMTPVFFGGVNVYLQQHSAIFRHTPAFIDRLFDNPALLKWAGKFAVSTRAADMGPMTVSILKGREGHQRKELVRLRSFLQRGRRPDLLVITNSMLSAIALEVKRYLDIPVACGLQGEDDFVAQMAEPYCSQARRLMQQNARAIDLFIATHEAYAAKMADYLAVPAERVKAIRMGIDAQVYRNPGPRHRRPFTLAYLSVITPGKGLDLLVEAFRKLVNEEQRNVVLRVAGKVLNRHYWRQITSTVAASGLYPSFEYLGELDFAGKVEFLRRCSALSLPTRFAEVRGMAVAEALATSVPTVVPDVGVFPEMISLTGGGILVPTEDPAGLADAISQLMDNPEQADRMGRAGANGIVRYYTADRMVDETLAAFHDVLAAQSDEHDHASNHLHCSVAVACALDDP